MQQPVLDLIDGLPVVVGHVLEAQPHQQGTRDVVALDARFTALTLLDARQLLDLTVILLDLPIHPKGARAHACCAPEVES